MLVTVLGACDKIVRYVRMKATYKNCHFYAPSVLTYFDTRTIYPIYTTLSALSTVHRSILITYLFQ